MNRRQFLAAAALAVAAPALPAQEEDGWTYVWEMPPDEFRVGRMVNDLTLDPTAFLEGLNRATVVIKEWEAAHPST